MKSGSVSAYRKRVWAWAVLAFLPALMLSRSAAAETVFTPRVSARAEYDDNVRFTREDRAADFVVSLKPSVELRHHTERLEWNSSLAARALRYFEESDLDREEFLLNSAMRYDLTERFSLQANASYNRDSALEAELQETGIVTEQVDRVRMSGGGGVTFRLTELQELEGSFSLARTTYDSDRRLDYDTSHAALTWSRKFRNQRDVLTIQPYWSANASDVSEVETFGLMAGWTRMLTENWSLSAFLGARRTNTEYRWLRRQIVFDPALLPAFPFRIEEEMVTEEDTSLGGVADMSARWRNETWTFDAGYNRDLSYSSLGEPVERDRLSVTIHKKIDERLSAHCTGTAYLSQYEGYSSDHEYLHVTLAPSVSYRLTEKHLLRAGFQYDRHEDRLRSENGPERKRVWISIDFAFPRTW